MSLTRLVLVLLVLSAGPASARRVYNSAMNHGLHRALGDAASHLKDPVDQWFTQTLDHFDPQNTATFKQRFQVNDTFYEPGASRVFLLLGGEGPIDGAWLSAPTAVMTYAQTHKAMVVQLEHRFYGQTQPFANLSTENLQFLSSEQALADAANFLMNLPSVPDRCRNSTKFVVFGGSYSGALSAWLRLKYPHVVIGSVATSAPVQAQLDFAMYHEVVAASLNTAVNPKTSVGIGAQCLAEVQGAFEAFAHLVASSSSFEVVGQAFNSCQPFHSINDIHNLASTLAGYFDGTVQYNKDNRAFEGGQPLLTIDTICMTMINSTATDPLQKLVALNTLFNGAGQCTDASYDSAVDELRNISIVSPAAAGRTWTYQTCQEFGYFQTTETTQQPFGTYVPLSLFTKQCKSIFGLSTPPNINWTNLNYGGWGIQTSRTIFVNGLIDPWHALSITSGTSDPAPILMKETAHCANMYPASDTDPADLTAARTTISNTLGMWLDESK